MDDFHFWMDDERPEIGFDHWLLAPRQWSSGLEAYPPMADVLMHSTQTMGNSLAAVVKAKATADPYATESEVIRDSLRTLGPRDRAMDGWLQDQVILPDE